MVSLQHTRKLSAHLVEFALKFVEIIFRQILKISERILELRCLHIKIN